jgi:hypothetical protein
VLANHVGGIAYPFVMTWIILWLTDPHRRLRSASRRGAGLDMGELAEIGYARLDDPEPVSGIAAVADGSLEPDVR